MNLVLQPLGSNQCGQACVATIVGSTLETATVAIGKYGKTRKADLVRGLVKLGATYGPTRLGSPPEQGIFIARLRVKGSKWQGHWVVFHDGQILDPHPKWQEERPDGCRPSSFFSVGRPA